MLNPLMNQSEDTLLMATIGLGFVLEGLAQAAWGVEVRRLDLGIGDFPIEWIIDVFGLFVSALDLTAGIVAAVLIIGLALIFKYTRMGLGLRAVADDLAQLAQWNTVKKYHVVGLVGCRRCCSSSWDDVGRSSWCSICTGGSSTKGIARSDNWWVFFNSRGDHWRFDNRRNRKSTRGLPWSIFWWSN